jgi:tetratricopeptide (TPR) repeat protein
MLGGENREAIAVGREALALAEALGLDDVRSHALNNIGVGRVNVGEEGGFDDLRSSIGLAVDAGSPFDTVRGWINLGATLHMLGYEDESRAAIDEAELIAKRFGYEGGVRWWRGTNVPRCYHEGRWDESLRSANEFIAQSEAGAPHYLTGESYCIRALLLLARADREGAKSDARRGLELTRSAGDPQLAESALANAAYVFAALDSSSESEAVLNELLGSWRTREQVGFAVTFSHHAAWAAWKLGRADGFLDALGDKIAGSRWLEVARAFACGEFVAAADIASAMRTPPAESLARFTAGELLIQAGRRDEGEAELRKALAFYRDARATWYLGRAEALLAASA